MKKYLLFLFLISSFASNAQNFKNPYEYLNYLGNETDAITNSIWQYTSAIAHSQNITIVELHRINLVNDCRNITRKIKNLKNGYNGDVEYKNQLLDYFTIVEEQINAEFARANEIQNGVKTYEELEAYTINRNLANEKIKEGVDKLNINQKVFADKYQIRITKNKNPVGEKMQISNEIFNYHTKLYLIFLKINMAESNFIDAVSKFDLVETEKNLNILKKSNAECFAKMKLIQPYKDDKSLLDKTTEFLEFSKKEASDFGETVLNYLNTRKNFEVQKTLLENKINLTNEEREVYNNYAQEKNFSFKNYTRINDYYNSERAKVIKDWNLAGDQFIDKYVPKD